jgi:hypothetical protein
MSMNDNPIPALEQALGILQSREASAATLKRADDEVRGFVRELDAESERGPAREAEILARMTSDGIQKTLEALASLDSEGERRANLRKAATALGAQLDERAREVETAEKARDPAVQREAKLQSLFAKIPALFRTDVVLSKLAKGAFSRVPRPQGQHSSYVLDFSVPRGLAVEMASTRVPGWRGDVSLIEQPCAWDEIEEIVAPLRGLIEKGTPSEDEVQDALGRAQANLLNEFGRVCAEIRGCYPGELPRSIALPAIGSAAMAAE